jgi:hypothetical protein
MIGHRMVRNYLAAVVGDAINVVLAVVGYDLRRLLAWVTLLLGCMLDGSSPPKISQHPPT